MKKLRSVVVPTAPSLGSERRPAAAALVLGRGIEQGRAAAGAAELALALLEVQGTGAGALGRVLAQHLVLHGIEFLAPILVALLDGIGLGRLLAHGSLLNQRTQFVGGDRQHSKIELACG